MRRFNATEWLQAMALVCLISASTFALSQSGTTKPKQTTDQPSATDTSTDSVSDSGSDKRDHARGKITNVVNTQQSSTAASDSDSNKKKHGKAIIKSTNSQQTGSVSTSAQPTPQPAPGKQDTKNVADGAAKGQASEGVAPDPNSGKGNNVGIVKERDMSSPGVTVSPNGDAKPNNMIGNHKDISDGAAKGQASEGVAPAPNGGKGKNNEIVIKKTVDKASPVAFTPNGDGKNNLSRQDPKDISDGAAKGQAVDGMAQKPNGGGKSGSTNREVDATGRPSSMVHGGKMQVAAPPNPNSKGNGKEGTTVISVDGLEHSHETLNDTAAKKPTVGGGGTDVPVESVAAQAPKGKSTGTTDSTKPTTDEKKP